MSLETLTKVDRTTFLQYQKEKPLNAKPKHGEKKRVKISDNIIIYRGIMFTTPCHICIRV